MQVIPRKKEKFVSMNEKKYKFDKINNSDKYTKKMFNKLLYLYYFKLSKIY